MSEIICLTNYSFTALLAFWTGFNWCLPKISGRNRPPSSNNMYDTIYICCLSSLSVPLLQHSMKQIMKSLASVSQCVSMHASMAAVFICTVVRGRKIRPSLFGVKIRWPLPLFYPNFYHCNAFSVSSNTTVRRPENL